MKFPHRTTSRYFRHKCNYCEPLVVHFTPTKQPVGSIVKLIDGTEYKVYETGVWLRITGRKV